MAKAVTMKNQSEISLMQQALGEQWELLPTALKAHYQQGNNTDSGALDIEYPGFMQLYLNVMRLMGALVNRRGKAVPATVEKWMEGDVQQWKRSIQFPGWDVGVKNADKVDRSGKKKAKTIYFKSHWIYAGGNQLIEYVNPFLGLRMAVSVKGEVLYYEGISYVLKLGKLLIPIPEWLVLGHTTIVEKALNENEFSMDFRLRHPWFGQLFRYSGVFSTE